jgi:LPS export ABC transporter protein LptC
MFCSTSPSHVEVVHRMTQITRIPIFLFAACLLVGCSQPDATSFEALERARLEEPASESFGITYRYSDSARVKAILTAPHLVERYDAQRKEFYQWMDRGFVLEFKDRNGKPETHVRAKQGRIFQKSGYAEAVGQVVVTSATGTKLETEKLIWIRAENQVRSDAFVRITTKQEILTGDGFVSNTAFTAYRITKLRGTLTLTE